MGTTTDERRSRLMEEPTPASAWHGVAGSPITDELLEWPPDVFALTNVILGRSEAFRFALSPLEEWPPGRVPNWSRASRRRAGSWSAWVEDRRGAIPDLVAEEWSGFRERAEIPLEQLARGRDWRLCEALLTLHAIADEACAGLGVALDSSDGGACAYRARGRELLARTGSLARVNPRSCACCPRSGRHLPGARRSHATPACRARASTRAGTRCPPAPRHRALGRSTPTLLLLPWPLRVRESDFRPVDRSVQRLAKEPFGFFEFAPTEGLDLDLLDRVLVAARDEVNSVDVVMSAGERGRRARNRRPRGPAATATEWSFSNRGPPALTATRAAPGQLDAHRREPEPRERRAAADLRAANWFHIRQNKHHRWSLDENQIYQYHLGGVLHPHIQWWEAMEVPRRAVQFVEVAELTLVCLVCEDLAQNDDVAELMRSVGPTVVIAALLDGPQLTSRWAARYASVLADDPGSAVLTLTSFGMVQRSPAARARRVPGHRTVEGSRREGSARFRSRPARTASFSPSAWIARPGAAPTAAGPSTTGPTPSTSPSTRFGPRVRAPGQPVHASTVVNPARPRGRRADDSHRLGRGGRRSARLCTRAGCNACSTMHAQALPGGLRSGSPTHPRD